MQRSLSGLQNVSLASIEISLLPLRTHNRWHLGAMEVAHEASRYLLDNNSFRPAAESYSLVSGYPGTIYYLSTSYRLLERLLFRPAGSDSYKE